MLFAFRDCNWQPDYLLQQCYFFLSVIGDLIIFSNEIIGQGAFGTVFKGEWQQEPCAAKMLSILGHEVYTGIPVTQEGEVREEALSKFKKECDFMKTFHHPYIVTYYETLFHPRSKLPVLAMELMEASLRHYITKSVSVSEWTQLKLCYNIAFALEFLHSQNVIHRDLCGDNILVNYSGDNTPVAKVTDFGMSRLIVDMSHSLSSLGHRRGYIPPEASERPVMYDSSLDIFMFGAVMTQIARNCPNIRSMNEREKLVKELGEARHPLYPIICQCLDERKENRPAAGILRANLSQLSDHA